MQKKLKCQKINYCDFNSQLQQHEQQAVDIGMLNSRFPVVFCLFEIYTDFYTKGTGEMSEDIQRHGHQNETKNKYE